MPDESANKSKELSPEDRAAIEKKLREGMTNYDDVLQAALFLPNNDLEKWIARLIAERDDGLLDLLIDAVLDDGFLPADLLQGEFAARFIEFFEAVETISGKAHHLAGLADVTQGLREC